MVKAMPTYRPLTDDEDELYQAYTRYAFAPQVTDPDEELAAILRRVGDRRGLFESGSDTPVAVCSHHWFESTVRGQRLSTPGVAAVAVPPEHRRRGHARTLLRASLEEYRQRGDQLSVLWPFEYGFYRSLGWEHAHRLVHHELNPSALRSVATPADGSFEPVDEDDWALLDAVYGASIEGFDLAFDRPESWWRSRLFRSWNGEHHVYLWRDATGEPRAYASYLFDGQSRDRTLTVYDAAATDSVAAHQLYRFLGDHDSQVGTVQLTEPASAPLLDALDRRQGVETTLHGGVMVRLVDVPDALSALSYPATASGTVVIDIDDPLIAWHDEPIAVTFEDGTATATRTDANPTVSTDIATLSAIAVGARTVDRYVDAGRITGDTEAIDQLAAAFPPRRVHCFDRF